MIVKDENLIILKQLYLLFYWEEPNYEDDEIDIKFQCMMRILEHYGIYLSASGFSINTTVRNFPFNHDIQYFIDKLKKEVNDNEVKLNKKTIMKVQTISISLHQKASEANINYDKFIMDISKVIHVNEQVLPHRKGKEIVEVNYITNTEQEIDEILILVKTIDEKIDKHKNNIDK